NRVYFQHSVKDCDRGKVLSIIMMDRGMIPLGSLIMSFFADMFGILTTFTIMGISTISISLIFYIIQRISNMEESNNES
ncbi:MFS transporter, partial [Staphylococcus epidermidis]|nr:MFS transporter [Staphylococcus epidermidis]